MPAPDPARLPLRVWRTVGAAHTVTVGRVGEAWFVEHTQMAGWHGQVCDSEQVARILADRERAAVPGRSWIELAAVE